MTLYQVPHLALGAELSSDYHERSIVMSYNSIFAVVGGAGAYVLGFTLFDHIEGGSGVRTGYPWLAAGVALIAACAIFASAYGTRDRIPYLRQPNAEQRRFTVPELVREIGGCLKNRNYRALMAGFVLLSATIGVRETLNPYVGLFFWQLPESQLRLFGAVTAPAFLLAFLVTVRLHRRFDKRTAIVGAIVVAAFGATSPVALRLCGLFPDNDSPLLLPLLLASVFVFAAGIATLMISLMSALADIADEHELATGRRQEGVFYAARTLFGKLTSALGHVLAGAIIDLIAFPSGAKPGSVPAEVLWKLGLFEGPIASLPALLAIFFYARYRIDRARHAEIQRGLAERRTAGTVPLTDLELPAGSLDAESAA
jgi:Na+/melibiose symporter-like transporter